MVFCPKQSSVEFDWENMTDFDPTFYDDLGSRRHENGERYAKMAYSVIAKAHMSE